MTIRIREARADDAASIVAVTRDVWPDESLDADRISQLIGAPDRATAVALIDDHIAGFVDGFLTQTSGGDLRWEVDLLAVSRRTQGHGLGRDLVEASVISGRERDAISSRALIRAGNLASERVFAANGFTPDRHMSQLWVSHSLAPPVHQTGVHIVPVRTFRYAGVWLEDSSAPGLCQLRPSEDASIIGAVISHRDRNLFSAATEIGMELEGEVRFWHLALSL